MMGKGRNWTQEDYQYLKDNYGIISIPTIAKKLNRSTNAINIKARRLNLGQFLESGDYITWNQLLIALGITGGTGYKTTSWIRNRNFSIRYKRVDRCKFKVVYIEEFWKWAELNIAFLNFSNFEENALGAEPDWVKAKRKYDCEKKFKYKNTPWTKTEDCKLEKLLKDFKYTYSDLSKLLNRTNGAIQRRICDLNLKERPIKADNHTKWTTEEYDMLCVMIKAGMNYELMSEHLNKSSKAIRGRIYSMYLTENLDKVISYIGNGSWGDGRPERKVGQWNCLSIEEKSMVKAAIIKLTALLLHGRELVNNEKYFN
ncbi:MAG: hypothetical protein K0S47_4663 [Herbinix sp.]|jgi:hypothetical protein|nr:hypothetical protein [Herbinix sp.]